MTLAQRGHMPPPEPGAPGMFALADADRIRELVIGAGFADPDIEQLRGRVALRQMPSSTGSSR